MHTANQQQLHTRQLKASTIHTRQLQQCTWPTNNSYTQDNLKLSTIHTRQIRNFTTCTKGKDTQVRQYCVQFIVIAFILFIVIVTMHGTMSLKFNDVIIFYAAWLLGILFECINWPFSLIKEKLIRKFTIVCRKEAAERALCWVNERPWLRQVDVIVLRYLPSRCAQ